MSRDRHDGHRYPTTIDFGCVTIDAVDADRVARLVTRRLGDESRDTLEALGLIGYIGGDRSRLSGGGRNPVTRVWREGRNQ